MSTSLLERQPGSLPSTSEVNPRRDGKKHCKASTLRRGKTLKNSVKVDKTQKEKEKGANPTQRSFELEQKDKEAKAPAKVAFLCI